MAKANNIRYLIRSKIDIRSYTEANVFKYSPTVLQSISTIKSLQDANAKKYHKIKDIFCRRRISRNIRKIRNISRRRQISRNIMKIKDIQGL